jgi:prophage antirepressor-like protein
MDLRFSDRRGRDSVDGLAVPESSQVHSSLIFKIRAVLKESWTAWFLKKKALGSSKTMCTTKPRHLHETWVQSKNFIYEKLQKWLIATIIPEQLNFSDPHLITYTLKCSINNKLLVLQEYGNSCSTLKEEETEAALVTERLNIRGVEESAFRGAL